VLSLSLSLCLGYHYSLPIEKNNLLTIIITQKQIVIISVFREILMILRPLATEATLALFYEKRVKKS